MKLEKTTVINLENGPVIYNGNTGYSQTVAYLDKDIEAYTENGIKKFLLSCREQCNSTNKFLKISKSTEEKKNHFIFLPAFHLYSRHI